MPVLNLRSDFAGADSLPEQMAAIGRRARQAGRKMALASAQTKDIALQRIAERLRADRDAILRENERDVTAAQEAGQSAALIDRLKLDGRRLESIAEAVEKVGALADPVGRQRPWRPAGDHRTGAADPEPAWRAGIYRRSRP